MTAKASIKPILDLQNISYQAADGVMLVSHISLAIESGEMISLIGPNGAGKSTLVKLILGLLKPTHGTLIKNTKQISYVPQRFSVPSILPLRAIDLLAQADGKRLNADQKAYLYDQLSITPLLNKQMHHLSGGETQRVLLARALLDKPDLLILDEPMQGLDPESEAWLYQFLDELPEFLRCAMLVVSHDLHWVMKGSRRVICLNKHICCQGVPSQIALSPEFTQLFGYQAPYIHEHSHCEHHLDHYDHSHNHSHDHAAHTHHSDSVK
ncbi:metal ABC transporter ATP-binding protein [Moraxella sp. FZFQ2102]|uniref:metal ABC transporter ATP-binding protein n=1 Tax=Moraxella sp. FZFQ2102 TaxID=2953752 RepID=UPI00209BDAFE|nr:metal ABC transporter ATP-binding protein [Moraxella sp. FZFQ2102]USZ15840.1 metal ABC transporter ATP-binding protein [Moraxella sp. FZFQ2102]